MVDGKLQWTSLVWASSLGTYVLEESLIDALSINHEMTKLKRDA